MSSPRLPHPPHTETSGHYSTPIVVLDFASLYPSVFRAYNLCYTTLLHKSDKEHLSPDDYITTPSGVWCVVCGVRCVVCGEGGEWVESYYNTQKNNNNTQNNNNNNNNTHTKQQQQHTHTKNKHQHTTTTTPTTGDSFVKPHIRPGILPSVLAALIQARATTRTLLKHEPDPTRRAVLDSRQKAIKLVANALYGFTGAGASPLQCVPLADSCLSLGAACCRRAHQMVTQLAEEGALGGPAAGCRVIYAQTDSLFVNCPAATPAQAVAIGMVLLSLVLALVVVLIWVCLNVVDLGGGDACICVLCVFVMKLISYDTPTHPPT